VGKFIAREGGRVGGWAGEQAHDMKKVEKQHEGTKLLQYSLHSAINLVTRK
jgi:hypothetical protein